MSVFGNNSWKITYSGTTVTGNINKCKVVKESKPEKYQIYNQYKELYENKDGNRDYYKITIYGAKYTDAEFLAIYNDAITFDGQVVNFTPHTDETDNIYDCYCDVYYDDRSINNTDIIIIELAAKRYIPNDPIEIMFVATNQFIEPNPVTDGIMFVAAKSTLEVVSPNGGESYTIGNPVTISWSDDSYRTSTYNVYIYKGGVPYATVDTNVSGSSAVWDTTGVDLSNGYSARVAIYGESGAYDESDAYFTVST